MSPPSRARGNLRIFGDDPGFYVPPSWGQFWYPKLEAAAAGTGVARIAFTGHSVVWGYYAARKGLGWAGLLTAMLQASSGDGGSGFKTVGDSAAIMVPRGLVSDAADLYDSGGTGDFMSTTGTWTPSATAMGPSGIQLYPAAPGIALQHRGRGTMCRIFMLVSPAGDLPAYEVSIDGISKGTISGHAATPGVQQYDFSGLGAGDHTVTLTYFGAASGINPICGIAFENLTGVIADNYAIGGALSSTLAPDAVAGWTGGPNHQADLLVVASDLNDLNNSVAPAVWIANVEGQLDGARGSGNPVGSGATDILLLLCNPGLFDTGRQAGQYAAALRGLAEHYGAAMVDFGTIGRNDYGYWYNLGYFGGGQSSLGASAPPANGDQGHPSGTGHALMADTLAPLVAGVPRATVPSGGLPAGGNSAPTAAAARAPAQATISHVSGIAGGLVVSILDTPTCGSAITSYVLEFALTGTDTWTTLSPASAALSQMITGLTTRSVYDVRVAAVNVVGRGAWSSNVTQTAIEGA